MNLLIYFDESRRAAHIYEYTTTIQCAFYLIKLVLRPYYFKVFISGAYFASPHTHPQNLEDIGCEDF
jgi:hypothetical protein